MPWGVAAAAVGAYGAIKSSKNNKEAAEAGASQTQKLDPRLEAMLFGDGTDANKGWLSQLQSYQNTPQNAQNAAFGGQAQQFLGTQGGGILGQLQTGSGNLLNSNIAAPSAAAGMAGAARSAAPDQNDMNLSGAYSRFINGDAGANPYLNKALQSGVDMTNASFQKNAGYAKDSLDSSLAGIRGNSVLAGQYGSSRQGVAEGNALKAYTDQLNNSNLQLGLANSANTTSAQAQAFNQGQDRSLAAMQSLSGQQYNTAQFNAGLQQQTGQFNASQYQQDNQFNAGLQGQTNALNSQNQQAGLAGMSGLLSNAYGYAQNQDGYGINRASQVNGLLSPYLGANSSTTTTQPYASNTGANIMGGATAGLGLYNGFKNSGAFNSWGNSTSGASNVQPSYNTPTNEWY